MVAHHRNRKQKKLNYLVNVVTGSFKAAGGCHDDHPESLSELGIKNYQPTRYTPEELPPGVDLRPYMSPVEDQAQANSCTANAVVGGYEYLMKRMNVTIDFSRLFVYYNARVKAIDLWKEAYQNTAGSESDHEHDIEDDFQIRDEGSSITYALASMRDLGICREKTWDYEVTPTWEVLKVNDKPSDSAYAEAKHLQTVSRFRWQAPEKIDIDLFTMKHCLAEGYPIVFGLQLFNSFDWTTKTGRVPTPEMGTAQGRATHGMHAMLAVGYKDNARVFIVRNSWGENWGDKGYCYISYDYLADPSFCRGAYVIKGHVTEENGDSVPHNLSEGVWRNPDDDFGPEFYEEYGKPEEHEVFTLEEAVAVLCYFGILTDGATREEWAGIDLLYAEYGIGDWQRLEQKMEKIKSMNGIEVCVNVAIKIILAHGEGETAFRISADFAMLDGKLTREEIEYWHDLGEKLGLSQEFVTGVFETLLQQHPDTVAVMLPAPLKLHSRGVAVEQLQKALTAAGHSVQVNGFFGKTTKQAVRAYQKEKKLKVDGIVDQKMWDCLFH